MSQYANNSAKHAQPRISSDGGIKTQNNITLGGAKFSKFWIL
tara:strand:- start:95 stop:220 length:126 start_codon:yes stop_codon:yes gene_type:complete